MNKPTTRRKIKGAETKANLLKTALNLFSQNGYEMTTMRNVAKMTGLSLGASYHYFRSKDELVLAFYKNTADEAREKNPALMSQSKSFKERFHLILEYKLIQLLPYRNLVKVLARHGADFTHPLSPFSKESKPIRDQAIELIQQAIHGSDFKCSKELRPHIATILWLYQMGIILFWANDNSENQANTAKLIELSLSLLTRLLQLSSLPLLSSATKTLAKAAAILISSFEPEISNKTAPPEAE